MQRVDVSRVSLGCSVNHSNHCHSLCFCLKSDAPVHCLFGVTTAVRSKEMAAQGYEAAKDSAQQGVEAAKKTSAKEPTKERLAVDGTSPDQSFD